MRAEGDSTTGARGAAGSRLRLLLVNPTIVDKREHVHIGLGVVGTYVKLYSSHEVRILDFMACRWSWVAVAPGARRVPVLAGGHHPTLLPGETMAEPAFDMLIIGEGEKPAVQLLDTMAAGAPLAEVPGLWWREGGVLRKTPKTTLLPAEDMPGVDWSLHDEETLRPASTSGACCR